VRILTRNPDHSKVKAIFELAACVLTLKHNVWSNSGYGLKKSGYGAEYHCGRYDGKRRIGDLLTTKPFTTSEQGAQKLDRNSLANKANKVEQHMIIWCEARLEYG
jgi:hypothetical protein